VLPPSGGAVWGGSPEILFDFWGRKNAFWCTYDVGVSPTSERIRSFFHTAVVLSDITVLQQDTQTSSVVAQEQCCCMLALINLKLPVPKVILLTYMVWIPGRVFLFPGIGNQEMSFPGFPGAREWRLLQYY